MHHTGTFFFPDTMTRRTSIMKKIAAALIVILALVAPTVYATDYHVDSIELLGVEEAMSCSPPAPPPGCIHYLNVDLPWKYSAASSVATLQDTSLVLFVTTEESSDPVPAEPWTLDIALVPLGVTIPSGYTQLNVVQLWTGEVRVACTGAVTDPN
jgi:hypothetical protein